MANERKQKFPYFEYSSEINEEVKHNIEYANALIRKALHDDGNMHILTLYCILLNSLGIHLVLKTQKDNDTGYIYDREHELIIMKDY